MNMAVGEIVLLLLLLSFFSHFSFAFPLVHKYIPIFNSLGVCIRLNI